MDSLFASATYVAVVLPIVAMIVAGLLLYRKHIDSPPSVDTLIEQSAPVDRELLEYESGVSPMQEIDASEADRMVRRIRMALQTTSARNNVRYIGIDRRDSHNYRARSPDSGPEAHA